MRRPNATTNHAMRLGHAVPSSSPPGSSSRYGRRGGGKPQIVLGPVCEERLRRGNLLKSAPIKGIAAPALGLVPRVAIAPRNDSERICRRFSGHNENCWGETLILADRHRLTLYAAAYLELAQRCTLPLATLDGALCAAARTVGVGLLGGG
jgi:hypothetical protein